MTKDLSLIKHVALDMDGTIYKGSELFPFTPAFLAQLDRIGVGYSFLTNNSSKSVDDYLIHLKKMGIDAGTERMYTSALATMDFLNRDYPGQKSIYLLGTESLRKEMIKHGYNVVQGDDEPELVVVGFDTELVYAELCKASYWIAQGKPFIATHPDFVCPTNLPTVLVDCGAVCACITAATGIQPVAVPGKPDPKMLTGIMDRYGIRPEEMAMVGDRIYTDIAMAVRADAVGVLVLTGECTAADAEVSQIKPDFVLDSVEVLGNMIAEAKGKK